jgi:hypothetical protein
MNPKIRSSFILHPSELRALTKHICSRLENNIYLLLNHRQIIMCETKNQNQCQWLYAIGWMGVMVLIQTIKATKMLLPLPPYVIGRTAIDQLGLA